MYPFNLRLFDADGAEMGAASAMSGTENGAAQPKHTAKAPRFEGGDAKRIGGSQTPREAQSAEPPESREAKYRELLKEYKDLDDKRMQDTIKKRFKNVGQIKRQFDALNSAVLPLYQMHGIAPGDVEALSQAIQNDDSYWERGAEQAGMTTQQYKQMQMTAAENTKLRDAVREQAANEQIAAWHAEAEAVRQQYPEFDLMREIQNPLFASLISSKNEATRLPLQAAYEACHVEEMRQMAARQAAKTAEANTLHSIRAGAHRPKEAGSGAEAAVAPGKIDIARLTRTERQELERRAERGERITFQEGSWKF